MPACAAAADRQAGQAFEVATTRRGNRLAGFAVAAFGSGASAQPATPAESVPASILALALLCLLLAALLVTGLVVIARLWRRSHLDAELLAEANSERQALFDLLDVWLWRSDTRHSLVTLRPPQGDAERVTEPAFGGRLLWQQFVDPDGDRLQAQFEARQPTICTPVTHLRPDGGGMRGVLRASRLSASDGSFAGYLGIVRNASAGGAAPAADTVAVGGDDDEPSAFSYTVSHDLRAPIRVVDGFARILKEDYGRLLDRIGNDHLDRLLSAAARMNAMIDALLGLSRLSSQPLSRQAVDLSQLAGFIAEDLRRHQPERSVQLTVAPGLRAVGDPTLLRILLENLLGNAWKYTARRETAVIRFGPHASEPGVYTLSDNGAGFDMRHAERLFGMFQRLHGASEFEGTGIGLASVRRIVRRHGGRIWAEAETGRGASFHFSLGPR